MIAKAACTTKSIRLALSSVIDVGIDDEHGELDKEIRQRWLDRRVREREAAARRERNLARFLPANLDDAVSYLDRASASRHRPKDTDLSRRPIISRRSCRATREST